MEVRYMNKVFLSHSSADKPYVSYIADVLGRDRCVYDAMCFEEGMKTLDEIFAGIDKSGIFVFFISDKALDSEWVQREIQYAEDHLNHDASKLSQIFPIIIDPNITHQDKRIPDFLKNGFGSYNLRFIENNRIALRKILAQQRKQLFDANPAFKKRQHTFYGRNEEKTNFQSLYDTSDGLSCLIASGIEGIGRRSYLIECLRDAQIIEEYYEPAVISMNQMDSIEDMLMRLSEVGFGNFTLESVNMLSSMNEKISALAETLKKIQLYKEHVIIYDSGCLVGYNGELVYWFEKALTPIRKEVTVSIAAKNRLNYSYLRKHSYLFAQDLSVLPYKEWMGLMRHYAQLQGVTLSTEDREYFRYILTGYPPQVIFCVDSICDYSMEYVKDHSYEIVDKFSSKVNDLLKAAIPEGKKEKAYGLLAFMSSYGIVPTIIMSDVLKLNDEYNEIFRVFCSLTICKNLGAINEYVEVNPVIADYVQRNRFNLPEDIKALLKHGMDEFEKKIRNASDIEGEDFESLRYYLKRNIIEDKAIPEKCMYSTIYLSAIYDLYNAQKYKQVIKIVRKLKEKNAFNLYDDRAQTQIQNYYCRSLAREGEPDFYNEVQYFKDTESILYDFLLGFMERNKSNFGKALEYFQRVIKNDPKHRSARREIVIAYRGLEDYSSAYDFAKANYHDDPENAYQIQPYFEILMRKSNGTLSEEEISDLQDMRKVLSQINSQKPLSNYYELEAQYATFVERDWDRAQAVLLAGREIFPESSYIEKAVFDCCEQFKYIKGMEESLSRLQKMSKDNTPIRLVYDMREVRFDAAMGKSFDYLQMKVGRIKGLNEEAKKRLMDRIVAMYFSK